MNDSSHRPPPPRLPRHARERQVFEQVFGRSQQATLAAMDAAGDDVPDQAPRLALPLRRMGVQRSAIPVTIADPFDRRRTTQLSCSVSAHASLEAGRRGIHVSRIGDALAQLSPQAFASLQDYASALCVQVAQAQGSTAAEVRVGGVLSYLEPLAGLKDKASIEHLELSAQASLADGALQVSSGLAFNHITACPCVQQTYKHSFDDGQRLPRQLAEQGIPLVTHSQRCRSGITITGAAPPLALPDLLAAVDRAVVRCQNTLPREQELLAVHRAHREPQFLEDALRELLRAACELLVRDHPSALIQVRSTSMESIHDFDLSGEVGGSVAELALVLAPRS